MRTVIRSLRAALNDHLGFTEGQFRGFLVLSFLTLMSILARIFLPDLLFPFKQAEIGDSIIQNGNLQDRIFTDDSTGTVSGRDQTPWQGNSNEATRSRNILFDFDPNKISRDSMKILGFNALAATSLVRYREKGGRIRKTEDLLRIYGVDTPFYMNIRDHVKIILEEHSGERDLPEKRIPLVELNGATASELETLPGIGPVFGNRIVKYRQLLGGFVEPWQLMEVYGMDTNRLQQFISYVQIDSTLIRSMDLNQLNEWELSRHPYLDKHHGQAIVRFREFKGKIRDIDDLARYKVLDTLLLNRIRPYIAVDSTFTENAGPEI